MLTSNPTIKQTSQGVQLIFQFSFNPIDYDGSFYSGVKDNHYRTVVIDCNSQDYIISSSTANVVSMDPKKFHIRKEKLSDGTKTIVDFNDFHFEANQNIEPISYDS